MEQDKQEIFKKKAEMYWDNLSTKCEENGVEIAFGLVIDPETNEPIMFCKGDIFGVSKNLAEVLRTFKSKILDNISV